MASTLMHQLAGWAERTPEAEALFDKRGGAWEATTWADYWRAAREAALGLIALGHQPGECVALIGANRSEWVICQFAIMAAGGVPAPIYLTCTEEQVAFIVTHSRSRIAICDAAERLELYGRCIERGLMAPEQIVCMDTSELEPGVLVRSLDALRALGRGRPDAELDARMAAIDPDQVGLLIYTSGTTGTPKAVQISHAALVTEGASLLERAEVFGPDEPFRTVSYLPLCHIAEQVFTNILPLATGGQAWFCDDLTQIKDYLVDVRPTLFLGVPRVWEKFQAVLEARLGAATGLKGMLTRWALRTELAAFKAGQARGAPIDSFARRKANELVISKIQQALGLDQLLIAATGAAPIALGTLEFFASIGIPLYEGYGMSETTGVATCPPRGGQRFGTVGRALPGVEIMIDEDDDEILMRGPIMTRGYLHDPEKTAELIDDEGWLHSGDLGSIDDDGYLRITGRKKDLIITAGGKNVAPTEIESLLKGIEGVGQAVVIGDARPYLVALLTLDPEAVGALGQRFGLDDPAPAALAAHPGLRAWLEGEIERRCNSALARYQTIKRFTILTEIFTIEGGELTPTMKLKRAHVTARHQEAIDALYAAQS